MDTATLISLALVVVFVIVGGVFAATEIALVSLRESQLNQLEEHGSRGAKVASLARNPNRFLAAVQIGVTVAGFFSAAYGASQLAPDVVPALEAVGLPSGAAGTVALFAMTLFIAYLSLVLGELVPKRLALQRAAGVALVTAPPLDKFATLMRPVIWLLSISTNAVVRLLGGDPSAKGEQMSDEELRDIVTAHEGLEDEERRIVSEVFNAAERSVREVMRPRGEVTFLRADECIDEAVRIVLDNPYSRYPVVGRSVDDIRGFVHVRDLVTVDSDRDTKVVADLMRTIVALPSTKKLLPAMAQLRQQQAHIAIVVDEYGGTDGIITLEDMVEELIGEIQDEYDAPLPDEDPHVEGEPKEVEGGLILEDFAERTGIDLPEGSYETVAGFMIDRLGRLSAVGDVVAVDGYTLEVLEMEARRLTTLLVRPDSGSS